MESINTTKLDCHYYLFIGDILFHNVTQFWCSFMSTEPRTWHARKNNKSCARFSLLFYSCISCAGLRKCQMIMLDYMWKHLLLLLLLTRLVVDNQWKYLLFWFLLHLCFFGNSVQKMCTSAPYHITMKTRILRAQV